MKFWRISSQILMRGAGRTIAPRLKEMQTIMHLYARPFHRNSENQTCCRNFSSNGDNQGTSSWPSRSTLLMITVGACGVGSYLNIRNYLINENATAAASVKMGQSVGRPTLGGPFHLIDHNKKVTCSKFLT
jgi:hypothetical protein